jgi:hypothetical protein
MWVQCQAVHALACTAWLHCLEGVELFEVEYVWSRVGDETIFVRHLDLRQ